MKARSRLLMRRSVFLAAIGVLVAVLTACTGRGGGQLPPDKVAFKGPASFGFSFSCEDSGGLNPPTGQLRIQLAYADQGSNPIGSSFGIHGIVDTIDPVLESVICIGQNPPPGGERADLPGPLPADVVGAGGLPEVVPDARVADHAAVPLRGHRAGQRPEPRPVEGRLLLDQAVDGYRSVGLRVPRQRPCSMRGPACSRVAISRSTDASGAVRTEGARAEQ